MSLITISQTTWNPPLNIPAGSVITMRGFYTQRFLDSDGVTPVEWGDGKNGFYYSVPCSVDGAGNLVIPAFTIHTTDNGRDNTTSRFIGQLFVDDAPAQPTQIIFGFPTGTGWVIPGTTSSPTSWGFLDIFNKGQVQLVAGVLQTLSASAIADLIRISALNGVETTGPLEYGDYQVEQNGSFISVNDSFTPSGGRTTFAAGGNGGNEYANVTADCSTGIGEINVQSTGITNLYGVSRTTNIGDGKAEQNGTILRVDDPNKMVLQTAANQAPVDAAITNGQICFYLDESGNNLKVRVRYSNGTYKTGTVALV